MAVVAAASAAAVSLAGALGCSKRPDVEECRQMLDRYAFMRGGPTSKSSGNSSNGSTAAYRRAEAQCLAEVSRKEYACAIEAGSPNDWEACIE